MWLANFEDGSTISSKTSTWMDLPADRRITGVQLLHPGIHKMYLNLSSDYDKYYFVCEAAAVALQPGQVVAEIIGGINEELGVVVEIRMEFTGNIFIRHFSASEFKYAKNILKEGKKANHRVPKLQAV